MSCQGTQEWVAQMWGPVQTLIFSWAEPNLNQGQPKLLRLAELIQPTILIPSEWNSKGEKCLIRYALGSAHEKFSVWINKLFQSPPKVKIPNRLGGKKGWAVPNWNRHF